VPVGISQPAAPPALVLALPLRHRGVHGFGGHLRYAWRHLAIVTGYGRGVGA
jgi:hypothetical protein